jgi:hypothetical protein
LTNLFSFLKSKGKQYEIDSLKQSDTFSDNQMDLFKKNNDEPTFYENFKTCIRKKLRERNYD